MLWRGRGYRDHLHLLLTVQHTTADSRRLRAAWFRSRCRIPGTSEIFIVPIRCARRRKSHHHPIRTQSLCGFGYARLGNGQSAAAFALHTTYFCRQRVKTRSSRGAAAETLERFNGVPAF